MVGDVEATEKLPTPVGTVEVAPEDKVRQFLAWSLLGLLAFVVLAGFALLSLSHIWEIELGELKSTVQLFFTSVLTLVSTVLGFYFGAEKQRKRSEDG